jgi:hypothetical protein
MREGADPDVSRFDRCSSTPGDIFLAILLTFVDMVLTYVLTIREYIFGPNISRLMGEQRTRRGPFSFH